MLVHAATQGATSFFEPPVEEDCIQPNAVDLKLDKIWAMHGTFLIDEEQKIHRNKKQIEVDSDGYYTLNPGQYEVTFQGLIHMGSDEAGYVITRSTLNRNGIFITSGLYDSGYGQSGNGSMAACLHVNGGVARIKPGTRLAQFLLWKAQSTGAYEGDYGKSNGMDAYLRK